MAVVLERPEQLVLSRLDLTAATDEDVTVDIEWSGISTGTERLLWTGRMPAFPGMGYPLVPGYESVGRVIEAGSTSGRKVGERVSAAQRRAWYYQAHGRFRLQKTWQSRAFCWRSLPRLTTHIPSKASHSRT